MEALILKAAPVASVMRSAVAERVARFRAKAGRAPKLSVVLVGEDPASVIYTDRKGKAAVDVGMLHETIRFPGNASVNAVRDAVTGLNSDPAVDGILIQRPLPRAFSEDEVAYWVAPEKDVDAFHPENVGRLSLGMPCLQPCTPTGIMAMLAHYGIDPAGKIACVIGRSSIVGKPMAALLMHANATLLQCHSRTPDVAAISRQADILVAAAGKPRLVGERYVKPGAVVIDVGIHRLPDGSMCGDVDFEAVRRVARALTPVPGGVGPMTIHQLLMNTVLAAEGREKA